MERKQKLFLNKRVARIRLDKYIKKQRANDAVVRDYVVGDLEKGQKVTVFVGDATLAANSPIKGYRRTPHRDLIKVMKRHPRVNVLMVSLFINFFFILLISFYAFR